MSQMNTPSMPPTSSDFSMPAEPPSWPKVIGIISIVWGSLGLFCNACGMISQLGGNAMIGMMPPEQQEAMKAQMAAAGPAQLAIYVFGILITILLIVAGVLTLQRRPLGRLLHLAYGGLAVVLTLISAVVTFSGFDAQLAAMSKDPKMTPQAIATAKPAMYATASVMICFFMLYPLFCLVWFGAIKRTQKDMTGGFDQEPIV